MRYLPIAITRLFIAATLLWISAPGRAAEQKASESTPATDPVEALIAPLRAKMDPDQARVIEFDEQRYFSFRREPATLQGIARVQEDLGLSLFYPAEGKGMIINRSGVTLRSVSDSGRVRSRRARNVDAELPAMLDALFQLDLEALRRQFDISVDPAASVPTLRLKPKEDESKQSVQSIAIRIGDEQALGFSIQLAGDRRIEIARRSEKVVERFDDETVRLYFAAP